MDIDAFRAGHVPKGRRSQLEPLREQLLALGAEGYSAEQLRTFAAAQGVEVSREAVRQFINRATGKPSTCRPHAVADTSPAAPEPPPLGGLKSRADSVSAHYLNRGAGPLAKQFITTNQPTKKDRSK